ncbi:MAG: N-acetyltransferase family protein [Candidatus Methylomirabilota bacterium]
MKRTLFRVREATPKDNAALLALDRECVIAAATPVAFDRSPDFFARSRGYSSWKAFVAEADSRLIGIGAMALKPALVGGVWVQAAYFYDLRVAPDFRRQGVAKAVGDAIRAYTRWLNPAVGYSLVMEGNVASLSFVQGRGSKALRSCALSLLPTERLPSTEPGRLRLLGDGERMSAFRLAYETHSAHDLFPFVDLAGFCDRMKRLREVGFRGLYGWDSGGALAGCVGLWDYSPVMRMRILEPTGEWSWAAAGELHLIFLMPLGFRGTDELFETVRLAAAQLRQDSAPASARVLAVPHDLGDPAYAVLDQFRPLQLHFTLFGLDLRGGGASGLGSRLVFIDPADL